MAEGTQAFPARVTVIRSFEAIVIHIPNGGNVDLRQATHLLSSSLERALVNHRPGKFLITDPPTDVSLVLRATLTDVEIVPVSADTNSYKLEFSIFVQLENGQIIASFHDQTPKARLKGLYFTPAVFVLGLSKQIDTCLEGLVAKMAESDDVNRAPWHANVLAIENEFIVIDVGSFHSVEVGNVFGIYRHLEDTTGIPVFERIATVISVTEGPEAAGCKYYEPAGPPEKDVLVGDRVHIHYF